MKSFNIITGSLIAAVLALILCTFGGCHGLPINDKPAPRFTAPPQLPAISPAAKQTATDADAALRAFDAFVAYARQFAGDAADTLKSFDLAASTARSPIVATAQSAAATVSAAGAKDAENTTLRAQLEGANKTIDALNQKVADRDAKIAAQASEFQTKTKIYAAMLGVLVALAIIFCIVVLKAPKTAITIGIAGGIGVMFLLSLGWFDANKGWILLSALGLVALLFAVEVVIRLTRGDTLEQAVVKSLTTSPLAYVRSLSASPTPATAVPVAGAIPPTGQLV